MKVLGLQPSEIPEPEQPRPGREIQIMKFDKYKENQEDKRSATPSSDNKDELLDQDKEPVIFPYQRIKQNPSTHDLGEPSGAKTDEPDPVVHKDSDKEDLVTIFRRMLDVGTPEYEHDLANYLHNGYPSLQGHYDRAEQLGRGVQQECDLENCNCRYAAGHGKYFDPDPEREAAEVKYFEEQLKEKERRIRIAKKIKTLHVTTKEDLDILSNPNPSLNADFDFKCYSPECHFATNNKAEYENHGVTNHPGKPCYPGKADLNLYGWKAQDRMWEI